MPHRHSCCGYVAVVVVAAESVAAVAVVVSVFSLSLNSFCWCVSRCCSHLRTKEPQQHLQLLDPPFYSLSLLLSLSLSPLSLLSLKSTHLMMWPGKKRVSSL